MSDVDEYDTYNVSFDSEILPFIIELPQSQEPLPETVLDVSAAADAPTSPKSTYSDEFSKYDLSEFTAEELTALDASIAARAPGSSHTIPGYEAHMDPRSCNSSGPAIEIEIEKPADEFTGRQTPSANQPIAQSPQAGPSTEVMDESVDSMPPVPPYGKDSHFYRFRRRTGTLAVTDLSAPSWCEVQFEYGLLQKRSRKLDQRPASFATTTGKVIYVDQQAAKTMDKIAKRGASVHKALEREIHPEKIPIEVKTEEERWALRILQMIESVQSLIEIGKCREMPVFGILQGQVVVGIIDEIQRRPFKEPSSTPSSPDSEGNDRKRERPDASLPSTPSKSKSKKVRCSLSPSQPSVTAFFSPRKGAADHCRPATPVTLSPPLPQYKLHVMDTKSRNTPTLPPEEDMLPARLQLMFYHRLLSSATAKPATSAHGVGFDTVWAQLNLSPIRPFSKQFTEEAGLDDNDVKCLVDVVRMWQNTVEMLHIKGVDDTLTIIYRTQARRRKSFKGKARAQPVQDSVSGKQQGQYQLLRDIMANVAVMDPLTPQVQERLLQLGMAALKGSAVSGARADKPERKSPRVEDVPGTAEQAVLDELRSHPKMKASTSVPGAMNPGVPDATIVPEADSNPGDDIIGIKNFVVDNDFLDKYLTSILQFWYGKRPPQGVDINLTRRCSWCEYRDGCEWREMKAEEAESHRKAESENSV